MNPIQFECPYCREINTGDESMHGQRVKCVKCQQTIFVPPKPVNVDPPAARLLNEPSAQASARSEPGEETEIFQVSPVARAHLGQIIAGLICFGLALGLQVYPRNLEWAQPAALGFLVLGVILLLIVWIRVKSRNYRLTTQRLFVRRGWLSRHVDELELYRVKDVTTDQGIMQRLLGYGTVTVLANDDTTPRLELSSVAAPLKIKETIRTQYRTARQKEKVHPTEFMRSP